MLTAAVKFSLLLEIQIDSPTPALERQAFLECVEQAVLADELGYDTVWAVEPTACWNTRTAQRRRSCWDLWLRAPGGSVWGMQSRSRRIAITIQFG